MRYLILYKRLELLTIIIAVETEHGTHEQSFIPMSEDTRAGPYFSSSGYNGHLETSEFQIDHG